MTHEAIKHVAKVKKSLLKRIAAPSPEMFIKIQSWCIWIGLALGAVSTYILTIAPQSKIAIAMASFAGFLTVIAPLLARIPVDEEATAVKHIENR